MVIDDAEHLALRGVIRCSPSPVVGPGKQGCGDEKIKGDCKFLHGKARCIQCTTVGARAFSPASPEQNRCGRLTATRGLSRGSLCTSIRCFCRMVCHA